MPEGRDYKKTLNLPRTDFSMRAGLAKKEPMLLDAWNARDLYGEIQKARKDAPLFVLHDGPPYANGHLHHGHILNKILKDMVIKDRTMAGYRVPYIPGWDCHGLPIETQVDKQLGKKKAGMTKAEIRLACRQYADSFVAIQRDEFRRLGVLGTWDAPYTTMAYSYEAQILRELSTFAEHGLLYKGLRPVNWCTKHQTALAEAEVEYEDHTSPSIYVAFPLVGDTSRLGDAANADLVIWTTTPWTLPANLATTVHPAFDYIAYPIKGRTRIIARGLADAVLAALGEPALDPSKILGTFKGAALEGLTYKHPLFARECPVILGEHVTLEAGTGCVHTAPGHGGDDFDVGRRYGLDVLSPVDGRGRFTEAAGPFAGKQVFAANDEIADALVEAGALLNQKGETVTHRYAHCWRCHQPIILRATEQWWVAIDKPFAGGGSLRERALAALPTVEWIPSWGEDRIRGMLETRPDWCLSRQRTWGVPIAVLYCDECGHALVDHHLMRKVAEVFAEEGADAWFTHDVKDLVGLVACPKCGGHAFRKEEDILDVWFDSGVSFASVIEVPGVGHTEGPGTDLYLEGSDQHRGWFHSALLCSLATRQRPPYRKVLTHGFFVDGKGQKISKSKGNFIDPFKSINQNGAELLRLWVAAEDFREDIRISNEILKRLADTYRKLRNTIRFLLGNLFDFDPKAHLCAAEALEPLDRYALAITEQAVARMRTAYDGHNFHHVVQTLNELCTVTLSAFYLDVLKDRLYCFAPDSPRRRAAQTAVYLVTRDLLRLAAPILAFTAEEAWGYLPRLDGDPDSVHLALYPGEAEPAPIEALRAAVAGDTDALVERFSALRAIRVIVLGALEAARQDRVIGRSDEAAVTLKVSAEQAERLDAYGAEALRELFLVSAVTWETGEDPEPQVEVAVADGEKCARCWLYRDDVGHDAEHPTICKRCTEALG